MAPNPTVMKAVEQLSYRVTVGDVAAQAGIEVNLAQRELLALASEAGGHLQVAESGDVVYLFPQNFRTILRNKFLQLKLQEWWEKVWRVLFYLIRISFGIILIVSIILIFMTIFIVITAATSSQEGDRRDRGGSGGGFVFFPRFWFGPDLFWFFDPDYRRYRHRQQQRSRTGQANEMNFLEAVFSFLFGDGNPNGDLEERRWQAIATVIRNQKGAVIAEQIAPYLDDLGQGYAQEYEEYMLPVLTRFNGQPEVSPDGQLVYHFPELQTTAIGTVTQPVSAYLRELSWRFSAATSTQLTLAAGLGILNVVGAIVLRFLLADGQVAATLGGLVAFVYSIHWLLLGYGIAFLAVPLVRYFWLQGRNRQIEQRNQLRQERAVALNQADTTLKRKLNYAEEFAKETIIQQENLVYTTESNLIDQEAENTAKIDAEWQRRLNQSDL